MTSFCNVLMEKSVFTNQSELVETTYLTGNWNVSRMLHLRGTAEMLEHRSGQPILTEQQ